MSKLHGLDAYGYVVNAWLDGELETSGLSEIPALGWFWSDLLKHRMWMIDELENWAGIIRENDQPFGDGEGFREEDPGDHVDQHQEDDDARPIDDFDPASNDPINFDPDTNDDEQRPDLSRLDFHVCLHRHVCVRRLRRADAGAAAEQDRAAA